MCPIRRRAHIHNACALSIILAAKGFGGEKETFARRGMGRRAAIYLCPSLDLFAMPWNTKCPRRASAFLCAPLWIFSSCVFATDRVCNKDVVFIIFPGKRCSAIVLSLDSAWEEDARSSCCCCWDAVLFQMRRWEFAPPPALIKSPVGWQRAAGRAALVEKARLFSEIHNDGKRRVYTKKRVHSVWLGQIVLGACKQKWKTSLLQRPYKHHIVEARSSPFAARTGRIKTQI